MRLAIIFLFAFCYSALGAVSVTNVTVGSGGGYNYTSLSNAEDGEDANPDLVSRNTILVFECYGFEDTTAAVIDGFTTDSTHYIVVTNMVPHGGKWNTSSYRLKQSSSSSLTIRDDFIRLYGLQIALGMNPPGAALSCILIDTIAAGGTVWISNCLIDQGSGNGTGYYTRGVDVNDADINLYFWNNIVYRAGTNSNSAANALRLTVSSAYVFSSVFVSPRNAVSAVAGTIAITNCYARSTVIANSDYSGTMSKGYCASSGNSGNTGLTGIAEDGTTFVNVSRDSEDYHIISTSPLKDVGVDTSGNAAPMNFTTDIDGQTRSGTWDIGADEYVAAGGATKPTTTYLLKGLLR